MVLTLIAPAVDRRAAWLSCHREWGPGLHEDGFGIAPEADVESDEGFAAWVSAVLREPGWCWWIVDDDEVLGGIGLRPASDRRVHDLGHIGYGVRPSVRGRGVATWALGRVLERARVEGINPALLVCRDDNPGSIKTIERCGGQVERIDDRGGLRLRHYAIAL